MSKQFVKFLMATYKTKLVYAISYKHRQKNKPLHILRGVWANRQKTYNSDGKYIFVCVNRIKYD